MSQKKYSVTDIKILKPRKDLISNVDISRKAFEKNLIFATQHAFEFACTLVINVLQDKIRYLVYLGTSYDVNPLEKDEYIFPEDYTERKRFFSNSIEIVELLWREGKVPEWIDVSVESEDGEYTYVSLKCCGRYSNDVKHIYHAHEGRAPFHVLGPPRPFGDNLSDLGKEGKNTIFIGKNEHLFSRCQTKCLVLFPLNLDVLHQYHLH
jgi:hypothetical protein